MAWIEIDNTLVNLESVHSILIYDVDSGAKKHTVLVNLPGGTKQIKFDSETEQKKYFAALKVLIGTAKAYDPNTGKFL